MVCGLLWLCVVLEESSWRAAGSSARLRSDLEMFVPGCRSLPECLHLYRPVQVKNKTVSITRETHPVAVFFAMCNLYFFIIMKLGSYCDLFL